MLHFEKHGDEVVEVGSTVVAGKGAARMGSLNPSILQARGSISVRVIGRV